LQTAFFVNFMNNRSTQWPGQNGPSPLDTRTPSFLITIDTEGDNLWERSKTISTRNAQFLPRFQTLCESYGFKPTYLTNYEMANCPIFQAFGKELLQKGTGEIGMHLHAWNSPPLVPLTSDDFTYHPYLIEYPRRLIGEKVQTMTNLLEETFNTKMISHRAGRWSFNEAYAQTLAQNGYRVDCSVAPLVSYTRHLGDPAGKGGTDYTQFPSHPYFLHPEDISRSGNSAILEVPMTTIQPGRKSFLALQRLCSRSPRLEKRLNRAFPVLKFRPNGKNRQDLLRIVRNCLRWKRPYLEFMLHSSELMPNGSPTFPTEYSIEVLYEDLRCVFDEIAKTFIGTTLSEFSEKFRINHCGLRNNQQH